MSSTRRFVALVPLGIALIAGAWGCATHPSTVTRMADGVVHQGRYIPGEAYAQYARGAALESAGELASARSAYALALEFDPRSPEILARLGSLDCRNARSARDAHASRALAAFDEALRAEPTSTAALSEAARCRARLGEAETAFSLALAAARADPDSLAVQLLVVDLAEAKGSTNVAREWLDALVARSPSSRPAWVRLAAFARRHGDTGRALRAAQALRRLHVSVPGTDESRLERALRSGELARARREAVVLRISAGDLAARAALCGALDLAREQAELALAADPTDVDAWIALLAIRDLTQNGDGLADALRAAPREPATPPSSAARRLLAELLERVIGQEARRAWDAASHP